MITTLANEWKEAVTPTSRETLPKRPLLTIRTVDEILAMEFDPEDSILAKGYLVRGRVDSNLRDG